MNLNFISSEILSPFDIDKHYGLFVYLMNDYKGYKYGLYFGGINGWERLTNDIITSKSNVDAPTSSSIVYTYNGKSQYFIPGNWDNIKDYVSTYNDSAIDAGTYEVEFALNDTDKYQWTDTGLSGNRNVKWTINPYTLTLGTDIVASLNKNEITYGDDEPYVSSVVCNHVFDTDGNANVYTLVVNSDYKVVKPTNFNAGTQNFIISFIGNFANNYTCEDIVLTVTVNKKKIDIPTNLSQSAIYNFDNVQSYNPTPDNWSTISSYCTITGEKDIKNVGTYTYTISLKDKNNYCWNDDTTDDKTLTFVITPDNSIEEPDWTGILNEYTYESYYKTNPINLNPINLDDISDYVTISGDTSASLPGTYTISVSLNDSLNQNWKNGGTDTKTFTITINSVVVETPVQSGSLTYNSGSSLTWYPSNWDDISSYCSITGNVATNAGTYTAKFTLNDKDGYVWSTTNNSDDIQINWEIEKDWGYFEAEPSLSGDLTYGNTLTVTASPVEDGAMTYTWYSSDSEINSQGGGTIESTTSQSIKLNSVGKYYGVVVNVAETDNYKSHSRYVYTTEAVSKKSVEFKLNSNSATTSVSAGTYALPGNNKPSDDTSSSITYTTSDDTIATISGSNIVLKSAGTVTITATISGSTLYDYSPSSDTFVLTINESTTEALPYWGYTPYWDEDIFKDGGELLKSTLSSGILPTNKITADMTDNGDGSSSFVLSAAVYESYYNIDSDKYPLPCDLWWFAIPVGKTITYMNENNLADIHESANNYLIKNSDIIDGGNSDGYVVNVGGVNYNIYSHITSKGAPAYEGSTHKFDITIK